MKRRWECNHKKELEGQVHCGSPLSGRPGEPDQSGVRWCMGGHEISGINNLNWKPPKKNASVARRKNALGVGRKIASKEESGDQASKCSKIEGPFATQESEHLRVLNSGSRLTIPGGTKKRESNSAGSWRLIKSQMIPQKRHGEHHSSKASKQTRAADRIEKKPRGSPDMASSGRGLEIHKQITQR